MHSAALSKALRPITAPNALRSGLRFPSQMKYPCPRGSHSLCLVPVKAASETTANLALGVFAVVGGCSMASAAQQTVGIMNSGNQQATGTVLSRSTVY